MVAILEKRAGFRFYDQDVYVNVAGGLRLTETACDLAITASLASSFMGKTIDAGSVFFGEVGLGGEVRSVPRAMERLKEAAQVGMKRAYLPEKTFKEIGKFEGLELYPVAHVLQLTDLIG
jgi:DNA repair protein RadA/Sms